ncbi:transmembrane protein 254-like [Cherax quadricarinatus]|uniref:transmembrane protein 254-like n=1 Tax=Cherax quadricarinatus TaxID=27406 RepID=UPI002377E5A4|nr:uncharacterized protein LOC128687295 [Cherax quadricarinatus]
MAAGAWERRQVSPDYFVLTPPAYTLFIGSGLVLMALTWQCPEVFDRPWLGLFGQFLLWLGTQHNTFVRFLFVPVMVIHVLEVMYAAYLCCVSLHLHPSTTLRWLLQILVVGILSLSFLIWPHRDTHTTNRVLRDTHDITTMGTKRE